MISISDSIQLQAITLNDQSKLMSLLKRIYPPVYRHLWVNEDCSFYLNKFYSNKNFNLELANTEASYYFVYYNSKLSGIFRFIYNTKFRDLPHLPSTYLNRIYLGEEAHGKGVAQLLFNWAEEKIMRKGNTLIWLKAMDSQKQAIRFYEKQGYKYGKPTQLDYQLIHPHLRGMVVMFKQLC